MASKLAKQLAEGIAGGQYVRGKKVFVGLSGGVDSAMSALLLKRAGAKVEGIFTRNWDVQEEAGQSQCTQEEDRKDAGRVAGFLGIQLHDVDFVHTYWTEVFEPFLAEYFRGGTPNPDVECNRHVKFGALLHHARQRLGADLLATGHYARLGFFNDPTPHLLRAKDSGKDQTYFLSRVPAEKLALASFPVGWLTKQEVREAAEQEGLPVARRRNSTGICFIGERKDFGNFLEGYMEMKSGEIRSVEDNSFLGRHTGLAKMTIGQRARLPGKRRPWFVSLKHVDSNTVFVCPGSDHPSLYSDELDADSPFWVRGTGAESAPKDGQRAYAQLRHRQTAVPCQLWNLGNESVHVALGKPARAVTPGQVVAIFDESAVSCLGSAIISSANMLLDRRGVAAQH